MPKRTCHLTYDQRCQIDAFLQAGISRSQIARQLQVHRSTITRELARNSGKRVYRHKQAHKKAVERRKKASSVPQNIPNSLCCKARKPKASKKVVVKALVKLNII